METKDQIVSFLREKYQPLAILLHGSRAVGKERLHSDWDIVMLFKSELPRSGYREEIADADVEWKAHTIPIADVDIISTFDVYLQFAQVLWEENGEGTDLLQRAKKEYAKGPKPYTEDEIRRERQFFWHKILGLEDDQEVQYLFFRHQCVIRTLSTRLWFEALNKQFSQPLYLAMPLIEEKDPEFYRNLINFTATETTPAQKIESAKWMFTHIFKP